MGTVEGSERKYTHQVLGPLAKLGWQIRHNKYKPTTQEMEALQKCLDDVRWYYLNGALFSGAVVWNLTGLGRKFKMIPRLFFSGTAAVIGSDIGGRFAGNACMKRILSLEGSQLRGELIAILQEDFPNHPLLRTSLGRHQESFPEYVHEQQEYGQEGPSTAPPNELALEVDNSRPTDRNWPEMLGRDALNGQESSRRMPRIWQSSETKDNTEKDFNGADILADPFDLVMQTGVLDYSDDTSEKQDRIERRRSRMSSKERREYDREQYQKRQEHRKNY